MTTQKELIAARVLGIRHMNAVRARQLRAVLLVCGVCAVAAVFMVCVLVAN